MKKLPTKLHELIYIALHDLEMVEKDPKYSVDMGQWHFYSDQKDVCYVCLAGSVMANTLELARVDTLGPNSIMFLEESDDEILEHNEMCMYALDELRGGEVGNALQALKGFSNNDNFVDHPLNRKMPPYEGDRDGFFEAMRELEQDLEAASL